MAPEQSVNPVESQGPWRPVLPVSRQAAAPDFERDVHVFDQGSRGKVKLEKDAKGKKKLAPETGEREWLKGEKTLQVLALPHIFVIGIALTVIITGGSLVGRAFTTGWMRFLPCVLLGIVGAALFMWFYRRSRIPKAPKEGGLRMGLHVNPEYRVQLAADRHVAYALRELNDNPFEPVVVMVPFALPRNSGWAWAIWGFLSVAAILGVFALRHWLHIGRGEPYEYWAAMGVAAAPFAFLWPTYLRVSPGRLELVRYPMLGAGRPSVETFDLRANKVRVHAGGRYISVQTPDGVNHGLHFGMWTPRRMELARAVLEGARCRFDAPALPGDELVG